MFQPSFDLCESSRSFSCVACEAQATNFVRVNIASQTKAQRSVVPQFVIKKLVYRPYNKINYMIKYVGSMVFFCSYSNHNQYTVPWGNSNQLHQRPGRWDQGTNRRCWKLFLGQSEPSGKATGNKDTLWWFNMDMFDIDISPTNSIWYLGFLGHLGFTLWLFNIAMERSTHF